MPQFCTMRPLTPRNECAPSFSPPAADIRLQQPEAPARAQVPARFGGKHACSSGICTRARMPRSHRGRAGARASSASSSRRSLRACGACRAPKSCSTRGFELGSVLTVHTAAERTGARRRSARSWMPTCSITQRILEALVVGRTGRQRVLIDRDFEAGDEPVKLCVRAGVPVELRKQLASRSLSTTPSASPSVFSASTRRARAAWRRSWPAMLAAGAADMPHEEAVRDLMRESGLRLRRGGRHRGCRGSRSTSRPTSSARRARSCREL